MDIKHMTEEQVWDAVNLLFKTSFCEDREEVKEMILSYNDGVSDEARTILKEALVVDGLDCSVENYGWIIEASGASSLNCTVPGTCDSTGQAVEKIVAFYNNVACEPMFRLVDKTQDILDCKRDGKVGVIIGAQSCEFLNNDSIEACVEAFSRLGLRIAQLAYNETGFAGDGCYSKLNIGLTKRGKQLIRAMEKNRMIVDLSHVGERTSLDAIEYAENPPVFSHCNPKELYDHPRNITLEQAQKCAGRGGVVGVHTYAATLYDGGEFPTIESFCNCIDYYAEKIGIDHVAIGSDSIACAGAYSHRDYLEMCNLHRELGKNVLGYKAYEAGLGYNVHLARGIACCANFVNVIDHLLKRGYRRADIEKILGLNWMRVYKQVWG